MQHPTKAVLGLGTRTAKTKIGLHIDDSSLHFPEKKFDVCLMIKCTVLLGS
jgi:hypothetical protein